MKRAIIFLTLLVGLPVYARLGESIAECEGRYGPVVEKMPAKIKESDPQACLFTKGGITIIVEFKAGKAWKVLYRMQNLDAGAAQTLLGAEASDGGWSSAIKLGAQEVRYSEDHDRMAILQVPRRIEDTATMTFVTKAYAAANRADYDAKLALIPTEVKRRDEARPLKDL